FASISDYLADDFQLARRVADLGLKIHLSDYVVESVLGKTRWRDVWNREVRWMRCIRVSEPWQYPGLLLTFSIPLAALLLFFPAFRIPALCALAISIVLRWLVALAATELRPALLLLPIRDLLTAVYWCAGLLG